MLYVLALFGMMALGLNARAQTQDTLALWTFENLPGPQWASVSGSISPGDLTPQTFTADIGTGTLYCDGSKGSTTWTATNNSNVTCLDSHRGVVFPGLGQSGTNDPNRALSIIRRALITENGSIVVFNISMDCYKDLQLSYYTQRTGAGFPLHEWSYSVDNGVTVSSVIGSSLVPDGSYAKIDIDFSGETDLNGAHDVLIYLTVTGSTAAYGGNNRLDNILFCADPITLDVAIVSEPDQIGDEAWGSGSGMSFVGVDRDEKHEIVGSSKNFTDDELTNCFWDDGLLKGYTAAAMVRYVEVNRVLGVDFDSVKLFRDGLERGVLVDASDIGGPDNFVWVVGGHTYFKWAINFADYDGTNWTSRYPTGAEIAFNFYKCGNLVATVDGKDLPEITIDGYTVGEYDQIGDEAWGTIHRDEAHEITGACKYFTQSGLNAFWDDGSGSRISNTAAMARYAEVDKVFGVDFDRIRVVVEVGGSIVAQGNIITTASDPAWVWVDAGNTYFKWAISFADFGTEWVSRYLTGADVSFVFYNGTCLVDSIVGNPLPAINIIDDLSIDEPDQIVDEAWGTGSGLLFSGVARDEKHEIVGDSRNFTHQELTNCFWNGDLPPETAAMVRYVQIFDAVIGVDFDSVKLVRNDTVRGVVLDGLILGSNTFYTDGTHTYFKWAINFADEAGGIWTSRYPTGATIAFNFYKDGCLLATVPGKDLPAITISGFGMLEQDTIADEGWGFKIGGTFTGVDRDEKHEIRGRSRNFTHQELSSCFWDIETPSDNAAMARYATVDKILGVDFDRIGLVVNGTQVGTGNLINTTDIDNHWAWIDTLNGQTHFKWAITFATETSPGFWTPIYPAGTTIAFNFYKNDCLVDSVIGLNLPEITIGQYTLAEYETIVDESMGTVHRDQAHEITGACKYFSQEGLDDFWSHAGPTFYAGEKAAMVRYAEVDKVWGVDFDRIEVTIENTSPALFIQGDIIDLSSTYEWVSVVGGTTYFKWAVNFAEHDGTDWAIIAERSGAAVSFNFYNGTCLVDSIVGNPLPVIKIAPVIDILEPDQIADESWGTGSGVTFVGVHRDEQHEIVGSSRTFSHMELTNCFWDGGTPSDVAAMVRYVEVDGELGVDFDSVKLVRDGIERGVLVDVSDIGSDFVWVNGGKTYFKWAINFADEATPPGSGIWVSRYPTGAEIEFNFYLGGCLLQPVKGNDLPAITIGNFSITEQDAIADEAWGFDDGGTFKGVHRDEQHEIIGSSRNFTDAEITGCFWDGGTPGDKAAMVRYATVNKILGDDFDNIGLVVNGTELTTNLINTTDIDNMWAWIDTVGGQTHFKWAITFAEETTPGSGVWNVVRSDEEISFNFYKNGCLVDTVEGNNLPTITINNYTITEHDTIEHASWGSVARDEKHEILGACKYFTQAEMDDFWSQDAPFDATTKAAMVRYAHVSHELDFDFDTVRLVLNGVESTSYLLYNSDMNTHWADSDGTGGTWFKWAINFADHDGTKWTSRYPNGATISFNFYKGTCLVAELAGNDLPSINIVDYVIAEYDQIADLSWGSVHRDEKHEIHGLSRDFTNNELTNCFWDDGLPTYTAAAMARYTHVPNYALGTDFDSVRLVVNGIERNVILDAGDMNTAWASTDLAGGTYFKWAINFADYNTSLDTWTLRTGISGATIAFNFYMGNCLVASVPGDNLPALSINNFIISEQDAIADESWGFYNGGAFVGVDRDEKHEIIGTSRNFTHIELSNCFWNGDNPSDKAAMVRYATVDKILGTHFDRIGLVVDGTELGTGNLINTTDIDNHWAWIDTLNGNTHFKWAITFADETPAGSGNWVPRYPTGAVIGFNFYLNDCLVDTVDCNLLPVITVSPSATLTLTHNQNTINNGDAIIICLNDEIHFEFEHGVAPYTIYYTVNGVDPAQAGLPNPIIAWQDTMIIAGLDGSFKFELTSFTDSICDAVCIDSFFVRVLPEPQLIVTDPGRDLCVGEGINLQFIGTLPYTLEYLANGVNPSMLGLPASPLTVYTADTTIIAGAPGMFYTFIFNSLVDSLGCTGFPNIDTLIVNVRHTPTLTVDDLDEICQDEVINLHFTSTPPFILEYEVEVNGNAAVNPGDIGLPASPLTIYQNDTAIVAGAPGTFVFNFISLEDGNGCVNGIPNVDPFEIVVHPTPVAPILTADTVCFEVGVVTFTAEAGFAQYEWDNSVNTVFTTSNVRTATGTGIHTYRVRAQDATTGCWSGWSDIATGLVYDEIPIPPLDAVSVCDGDDLQFTTVQGFEQYEWEINGNSYFTAVADTTITAVGNYTVRVKVQNDTYCWSDWSEPVTVDVWALPVAPTLIAPAPVCEGESLRFDATPGFDEYEWNVNGTPVSTGNQHFLVIPAPVPDVYEVYVSVRDDHDAGLSCWSDTSNHVITEVWAVPQIPTIAVDKDGDICFDNIPLTFTATPDDDDDIVLYEWRDQTNGWTNTVTTLDSILEIDVVGEYNFDVRVQNTNGCWSAWSRPVQAFIRPMPGIPVITPANIAICENTSTDLTAFSSGADTLKWYLNGNLIYTSIGDGYTYTFTGPAQPASPLTGSDYVFTVEAITQYGCTEISVASTVTVIPKPAQPVIREHEGLVNGVVWRQTGSKILFEVNNKVDGLIYQWYYGNASITEGQGEYYNINPIIASHAGIYHVVAINPNSTGCPTASESVELIVRGDVFVPRVLSPGQQTNDYLHITGLEMYPHNQLVVVNRWGNEVYRKDDYSNTTTQWRGENLPDGVYFYRLRLIEFNGYTVTKDGYFHLTR